MQELNVSTVKTRRLLKTEVGTIGTRSTARALLSDKLRHAPYPRTKRRAPNSRISRYATKASQENHRQWKSLELSKDFGTHKDSSWVITVDAQIQTLPDGGWLADVGLWVVVDAQTSS
ncbi:hypothetical protein M422DRAFT_273059 [Sphaerobolus stellatus SS14]|uniref:Uncharacterized protein n=1 Tax=Sphaerobolus stellatus (strain SS14) TaxID=990650 RepID=A0A0C9UL50_SPHS4|nr:hypothetical protein M422DRAFT_273059 [Sphaerobolus stellatus SS14]